MHQALPEDFHAEATLSNEKGVFRFGELPPGRYKLRAHVPGGFATLDDDTLGKMAAFKYFYRELLSEYDCKIVSTECWTAMLAAVGAMPCTAMSLLADEDLIRNNFV